MQRLEISRSALLHNVSLLRSRAQNKQMYPCIKANAYGHGFAPVVEAIDGAVDGYCVVSTEEALLVRALTAKPIVVLNIVERAHIAECAAQNITLPLACEEQVEWYDLVSKESGGARAIPVHLEIDTGMARTGFRWHEVAEMQSFLSRLPKSIQLTGIFSHYAAVGEDDAFSREQLGAFAMFVQEFQSQYPECVIHMDKSASLFFNELAARSWNSKNELVRPGISLYGLGEQGRGQLQPVLTWKTEVVSVREVNQNEPIGYGLTYRPQETAVIATVPVGYADGYGRSLSNIGEMLIGGVRCPIRGRICMNLTMVEVPKNTAVRFGDEVVLIGSQNGASISALDIANSLGTTEYEIVTRLRESIERVLVE